MKHSAKKSFILVTTVILLTLWCFPALAALTSKGQDLVAFHVSIADEVFLDSKVSYSGKATMVLEKDPIDFPDGTLVVSLDDNMVMLKCGTISRTYYISDFSIFVAFTASCICNPILEDNLLSEGLTVYFFMNEEMFPVNAENIQVFIDMVSGS